MLKAPCSAQKKTIRGSCWQRWYQDKGGKVTLWSFRGCSHRNYMRFYSQKQALSSSSLVHSSTLKHPVFLLLTSEKGGWKVDSAHMNFLISQKQTKCNLAIFQEIWHYIQFIVGNWANKNPAKAEHMEFTWKSLKSVGQDSINSLAKGRAAKPVNVAPTQSPGVNGLWVEDTTRAHYSQGVTNTEWGWEIIS